jgi:hypothetical protein
VADQCQHVERLLDVALYAPIGLALTLRDQLPRRLRQHRQALENRVQLFRFVGELAVRYGRTQIERELRERGEADAAAANGDLSVLPEPTATATSIEPLPNIAAATVVEPAGHVDGVADELPIGDYESLAAIHVVQRLGTLRYDEIEQIRKYEFTHRARRTVLAKIAQLQGAHA